MQSCMCVRNHVHVGGCVHVCVHMYSYSVVWCGMQPTLCSPLDVVVYSDQIFSCCVVAMMVQVCVRVCSCVCTVHVNMHIWCATNTE